ncbi:MAG: hypothetical protein ABL889_01835 [Terricaulis sp.]
MDFSPPPPPFAAYHACPCGALYIRRVVTLPIKDIGLFDCELCGVRIEQWSGRSVPVYDRQSDEDASKIMTFRAR